MCSSVDWTIRGEGFGPAFTAKRLLPRIENFYAVYPEMGARLVINLGPVGVVAKPQ